MTTNALSLLYSKNSLTLYLTEINKFPMLQPEQEYMLAKRYKEHGDVVGNTLNILNKRLKDVRVIDARIGTFTKLPYYQLEDKFKNISVKQK